jgi:hypothetical protein
MESRQGVMAAARFRVAMMMESFITLTADRWNIGARSRGTFSPVSKDRCAVRNPTCGRLRRGWGRCLGFRRNRRRLWRRSAVCGDRKPPQAVRCSNLGRAARREGILRGRTEHATGNVCEVAERSPLVVPPAFALCCCSCAWYWPCFEAVSVSISCVSCASVVLRQCRIRRILQSPGVAGVSISYAGQNVWKGSTAVDFSGECEWLRRVESGHSRY